MYTLVWIAALGCSKSAPTDEVTDVTDTTPQENGAPTGLEVRIVPDPATDDDALSCVIATAALDPDGDAVSYRYAWTADGVDAGVAEATVPSTLTSAGQRWICVVTPTDGQLDGAQASASVEITRQNTAPTAPLVAIVPPDPRDEDPLRCAIVADSEDADGDAVTYSYAWTVDGESEGFSGDTIDAARTDPGQTWACTVTASDGITTSEAATASATVAAACWGSMREDGVDGTLACAGTFVMGCTSGQGSACLDNEYPPQTTTLTHDVLIGAYEVTQGDYTLLMGTNPSSATACGDDCPVEQVDWHMAAAYANALSRAAGLDACYACSGSGSDVLCTPPANPYACEGWRMPTEAEWEYGARCDTDDFRYPGSDSGTAVAWVEGNSGGTTHPVGTKTDNGCGLYDMGGNVWEWVSDYSSTYNASATDPFGSSASAGGMARGGSAYMSEAGARTTLRSGGIFQTASNSGIGFRLARTIER
jgi:formylglycine-generating enzyme required for sulfatase activity